ncbi:MAG TPA: polysaccharide deacetylase family protein [Microbacteriaceae bacterium]|nr:polysaccharide deacetylase family protein [Microbacteriaceae bacterium]
MIKATIKRVALVPLVFSLLGVSIPTFVPTSWVNIEPISWEPLAWPGMDVTVESKPEPIDVTSVEGIIGQRILNLNTPVQARYVTVPGSEALNFATVNVIKTAIADQEVVSGVAYQPEAHSPGAGLGDRGCVVGSTDWDSTDIIDDQRLGVSSSSGVAVVCDVFYAGGSVLAQKLRTVTIDNKVVVKDSSVVVYHDVNSDASLLANELWNDDAAQYLWDAFIAVVKRDAGAIGLTWVSSTPDEEIIAQVLNGTIVRPDATLIVTFPPGVVDPELQAVGIEATESEMTIGFPEQIVSQLLSDFGKHVLETVRSGVSFQPTYVWAGNADVDCRLHACVALTYDDGPSPEYTPGILDAFAANHASATFFVLGSETVANPEIVARAHNEGHLVHNHSWSHKELTKISAGEIASEINQTNTALYDVTGVVPTTFRPPYGSVNEKILSIANMPAILWDVDTNDWQGPEEDVLIERAVNHAVPGSIVLQHDVHANTANTVWEVIAGMRDRGFMVVNLEQLFGGEMPTSGVISNAY